MPAHKIRRLRRHSLPLALVLLDKVDTLIIGGGMSYTFQKAHGGNVGKSLVEDDYLEYAKEMMEKAEKKGVSF